MLLALKRKVFVQIFSVKKLCLMSLAGTGIGNGPVAENGAGTGTKTFQRRNLNRNKSLRFPSTAKHDNSGSEFKKCITKTKEGPRGIEEIGLR